MLNAQDYYPFSSITFSNGRFCGYSFEFNGQEKDNEGMGGGGSTYDYGFRIYNAQLGKFLSVDPLASKFPFYAPYHFAGNKPIVAVDLDGLEDVWIHVLKDKEGTVLKIWTYENISKNSHDRLEQLSKKKIPITGLLVTEGYADKDKIEVLAYLPPNPDKSNFKIKII